MLDDGASVDDPTSAMRVPVRITDGADRIEIAAARRLHSRTALSAPETVAPRSFRSRLSRIGQDAVPPYPSTLVNRLRTRP